MLTALGSGPSDLYAALPIAGDTIGVRKTSAGQTVYYAVLDEPLRDRTADPDQYTAARCGEDSAGRFVWVSDVVFRPVTPGAVPHFGMQGFPIELAYVLDPENSVEGVSDVQRAGQVGSDIISAREVTRAQRSHEENAVIAVSGNDVTRDRVAAADDIVRGIENRNPFAKVWESCRARSIDSDEIPADEITTRSRVDADSPTVVSRNQVTRFRSQTADDIPGSRDADSMRVQTS